MQKKKTTYSFNIFQTTKLKNALETLEPSSYVAFHGMKGFGKSSLTAKILQEKTFAKVNFGVSIK